MSESKNSRAGALLRQHALAITASTVAAISLLPVCLFAPPAVQTAYIGLLLSVLLGISIAAYVSGRRSAAGRDPLQILFRLARDEEISEKHQSLGRTMLRISEKSDPLFRSLALQQLSRLVSELKPVGEGIISFDGTETWRLAYEQLLRSSGLHTYHSIACVDSANYWQDEPGRRSMALNYEMQESGTLSIERTVILADELWPANEDLPAEPIRSWIDEQHRHGIWIRMVRRCALVNEPDLFVDLGIYGSRAVGAQEHLGDKTIRFTLTFDFDEVTRAEEQWARLAVYATSYRDALDRLQPGR